MITQDALGNRMSGASVESLGFYETALRQLRCYIAIRLLPWTRPLPRVPTSSWGMCSALICT